MFSRFYYSTWQRVRISSIVHLPEFHNVQKGEEDAEKVRFCQMETEAENFSIDKMEKRICANKENQEILLRST